MLFESPNLRVELDDQIATLWLDFADPRGNRFTLPALDDLEAALRLVRNTRAIDILLLRSANPRGFSPGLDPGALSSLATESASFAFAGRGQSVFSLLASLPPRVRTVAFLEGPCLGAGLELALACEHRLAVARPDTEIGFPEIPHGLIPCWGGTCRLPGIVGLRNAFDLLLTGRLLSAREAERLRLVDIAFCERRARIELQAFLDRLQDNPRPPRRPRSTWAWLRDSLCPLRWQLARRAASILSDNSKEELPACHKALRSIFVGSRSIGEGLALERQALSRLLGTPEAEHGLRWLRREATPARVYPEPFNPIPLPPKRVAVIGSNTTAVSLSRWFALMGREVVLQESNEASLSRMQPALEASLKEAVQIGWATRLEAEQAGKAIRRTSGWIGVDEADLVIEAGEDDPISRADIIRQIEACILPRTIIAITSPTCKLADLEADMQRPARLAGLHFLDPSLPTSLVEISRGPHTDSHTLAALDSWMRAWRRRPVLVGDRPGRLVLPIELAYLSEAIALVAEGLPPLSIDREMRKYGMPEGPLQRIDRLGFDFIADLADRMQKVRGSRFGHNLLLARLRAHGLAGRPNGEGFYVYRGRSVKPNEAARMLTWRDMDEEAKAHYIFDPETALATGVERLILRTVNEAASCLAEEMDGDPETIDYALAIGIGWAPLRGGPLRYADELGLANVTERLALLAEQYGPRFEPCLELQRRAAAGESFYDTDPIEESVLPLRHAG